jgi:hypothetical protein
MQNSVERLTEKIHEVAYSLFTYLTPRINRHFTAALLRKGEKRRSDCSGYFRRFRWAKRNRRQIRTELVQITSSRSMAPPTSRLRTLAWIIERANLSQLSTDNKAQIHNMIYTVSRLHVEDGRDVIAIDYVLLYFYTLDERKDAREEAHYRLTAR